MKYIKKCGSSETQFLFCFTFKFIKKYCSCSLIKLSSISYINKLIKVKEVVDIT